MSFTIYDASIPPMIRMFESLSKILDKAEASGIPANELLEARLAPDMHPFPKQIQLASDSAKGCAARLSGQEPPSMEDNETTFSDLQRRIAKTIAFMKSVTAQQCEGAETRDIVIKTPKRTFEMKGDAYVNGFVLPNFYFHVTTAYDILRYKGVEIGKRDYLGSI